MIEWFCKLDSTLQCAIISAVVSAIICFIPLITNFLREKYMLGYKLRKEYTFKQRMGIKEKLASSKTPLIRSAEELNYRLWNLSKNIDNKWHNCNEPDIKLHGKCYYIKSFVYRFLCFLYWVDRAEDDIYNFDFSVAAKEEKEYLKYIKILKHFFCESELLRNLGYDYSKDEAHFYKDNIKIYVNYIKKSDSVISYDNFIQKIEADYAEIQTVVDFIRKTVNDESNCQYNILKSFHLFLMLFLNKYGLDYHYTDRSKYKNLIQDKYHNIAIKPALLKYFARNKATKEVKWIIKHLCKENYIWYRIKGMFTTI